MYSWVLQEYEKQISLNNRFRKIIFASILLKLLIDLSPEDVKKIIL